MNKTSTKIKLAFIPFLGIPLICLYLIRYICLAIPRIWDGMMDKLNEMATNIQKEREAE